MLRTAFATLVFLAASPIAALAQSYTVSACTSRLQFQGSIGYAPLTWAATDATRACTESIASATGDGYSGCMTTPDAASLNIATYVDGCLITTYSDYFCTDSTDNLIGPITPAVCVPLIAGFSSFDVEC